LRSNRRLIETVQRFSPTLVSALLARRQLHVQRFVYRANGSRRSADKQRTTGVGEEVSTAIATSRHNSGSSASVALRNMRQTQVEFTFQLADSPNQGREERSPLWVRQAVWEMQQTERGKQKGVSAWKNISSKRSLMALRR
jgi:triacylglycerol esterase/lipase EstA (alpha/beta hydrolase family)